MTHKEKISALCDIINSLDDAGCLLGEERDEYYAIINALTDKVEVFHISTIHIENLGTQVREMWIDHERKVIEVYAHTQYVYDMTQHEIDTTIGFDDIIDCAITLRANGNTTLTIDIGDDIITFYFENQDEGFAIYQIIAKELVNHR